MHPMLISTPEGVALARERFKKEKWAKALVVRLRSEAKELEDKPLPAFDTKWWAAASAKKWIEIYPEVSQHTYFGVAPTCLVTRHAAMAYAATGDDGLAETVGRVLLHYANYEFFAEHPDVGMNWSIWCMNLLHAYDLVYETMCPDGRAKIDAFFGSALAAIRKNDDWWLRDNMGGLFNNHLAWHKLFMGSYGLFYDKPELVDYAINTNQGIRELIENASRDDGLWFESSINYHFAAMPPLVEFARELANSANQFDLWNSSFANGRCLRELVTGPIRTLFPDETLPTIGDCYANRARIARNDVYYLAYDAYQLPEIAWLLRNRNDPPPDALFLGHLPPSRAKAPAMHTRIWPEHGYVALRADEGTDYWHGHGFSVFLSRDLDSVHSHRDKFDLMVFGRGAHLAADVEAKSTAKHAFSSRVMGELNRSTICHNTVMVDGNDHRPIGSKLELVDFVDGPEIKLATIADKTGLVCPGVAMMRTVAATRDYVLDIFQLASESEHTYDYLFHTYSDDADLGIDGRKSPAGLPDKLPWTWLRDAVMVGKDGAWEARAVQGRLKVRLSMAGCDGTQVITCKFPAKDDFSEPPIPMLIARRKAKRATFVSVLQAEKGSVPDTEIAVWEDRHGRMRVRVSCAGKSREFMVSRLSTPPPTETL